METNMKKVCICYNQSEYSEAEIASDMLSERYNYNFILNPTHEDIVACDEFWVFGDCSKLKIYYTALQLGKDIWVMGD